MPDLDRNTWLLIGGAFVAFLLLVFVFASRRGRDQAEQAQKNRRGQTLRMSVTVVLVALIAGFAFSNTETVEIDWILTTTRAPMVVVIALSGGVGFLAGLLAWSRGRSPAT